MSHRSVLVIEDSPDLALLAKRLLEKMGFAATTANTGTDALKLLTSTTPNVILMDLSLPDIKPNELVEEIRKIDHCKETPLVLVSGNSEIQTWGDRLGTPFVLTKPFDRNSLSQIVEKACAKT
jgi:CheY-like chemotaxis protein